MEPNLTPTRFDESFEPLLIQMAEAGLHNAARGISTMVGQPLSVSAPEVSLAPITSIPTLLGGAENEAVGIYLRAEGDLSGQFMLILPIDKALELVDLLMEQPRGTTRSLGSLERSALAELGNLSGSFFLNAVASITGLASRPSPPAVMVDMVGAILDILLATWDGLSEEVLLIQARFLRGGEETEASFWLIPDRSTLAAIRDRRVQSNGR